LEERSAKLRTVEREIRKARRQLVPLERGVEERTLRARRKRIRENVMMRVVRAVKLQSWWRGVRVFRAYRRGKWRDWVETWHEDSKVSYLNIKTGMKSRFKPLELSMFGLAAQRPNKSGWIETWDVSQQSYMYYHVERKEFRWQKPSDFEALKEKTEEEDDDDEIMSKQDEIMQFTIQKPELTLPNLETEAVANAVRSRAKTTGRVLSEWIELYDEKIGHAVWENSQTKKLSWNAPNRSELSNTGMRTGRRVLKWEQLVDESSGEFYYVNTSSGEISWTRPSEVASEWFEDQDKKALTDRSERTGRHHFQWQEYVDPETKLTFYYDERTGKTSWTRPHEEGKKWFEEQTQRRKSVRKSVVRRKSSLHALTNRTHSTNRRFGKDWVELMDRESGFTYYSNECTGETRWSLPPSIIEDKNDGEIVVSGSTITDQGLNEVQENDDVVQEIYAWGGSEYEPSESCEWDQEREALVEKKQQDIWEQVEDDEGRTYYFNVVTGESRWTLDEDAVVSQNNDLAAESLLVQSEYDTQWECHTDDHGVEYWYNIETGESQWENPFSGEEEHVLQDDSDDVDDLNVWETHTHETHGVYYYNIMTGESQWEMPSCLMAPKNRGDKEEGEQQHDESSSSTWDENFERHVDDDGNVYWYDVRTGESHWDEDLKNQEKIGEEEKEEEDKEVEEHESVWEAAEDEDGNVYYYNHATGETTWELPWVQDVVENDDHEKVLVDDADASSSKFAV
jgi:outer membrane protein assembly factor BamB